MPPDRRQVGALRVGLRLGRRLPRTPEQRDVSYHRLVPLTLKDGLRALQESAELAASIEIDLDNDYLANITRIEARAENQSGAEKSWVGRADRTFRATMSRARRRS